MLDAIWPKPDYSDNDTTPFHVDISWVARSEGKWRSSCELGYIADSAVHYDWPFDMLANFLDSLPSRFFSKWLGKYSGLQHWNICESDFDKERNYVVRLKIVQTSATSHSVVLASQWAELIEGARDWNTQWAKPDSNRRLKVPWQITRVFRLHSHPDKVIWDETRRIKIRERVISEAARKIYKKDRKISAVHFYGDGKTY